MAVKRNFLLNHTPLIRSLISLAVAAAVFFGLHSMDLDLLFRFLIAWIGFSLTFLILSWMIIIKRKVAEIKERAKDDDGSVAFVFIIIILSSICSMVVVLLLNTSKDFTGSNKEIFLPFAVAGMLLAWFMIHSQYVFHYAHEYYDEDGKGENASSCGLEFPDDDQPDYLDFAYFSFCLGSTFQVSDVSITNKVMRRIVLVHGLLSFFINTFVVALTINLIAGMSQ